MRVSCVVLLAAAVLGCGLATANAAEPSLGDLNGHSIWKQLEEGFRGLEQAALGKPMKLHPALQAALRGVHPDTSADASADASAESAEDGPLGGLGGLGALGRPQQHDGDDVLAGVLSDERDEDSSEEDDGDSDDSDGAFPAGPVMFPFHSFFGSFSSVWWKGPNVCITRDEIDETPKKEKAAPASSSQEDSAGEDSSSPEDHSSAVQSWLMPGMFQDFHFSSCSQTPTTYQCTTRSANHGVRKKVVTTYKCCHGARREYGQSGCKLVDMSSMLDTARELGPVFSKMIVSAGAQDLVDLAGNTTLFVPTNDAMEDFYDVILDQNRVRRALGPHPVVAVMVSDDEPPAPAAPATLPVRGQPEHEPLPMPVAMAQTSRDAVIPADVAAPQDVAAERQDDEIPEAKMADPVTESRNGDAEIEPKKSDEEVVAEAERKHNAVVPKKDWRSYAAKAKDPLDNELADVNDHTLVGSHRVEGLVDLLETRNDQILNTTAGTTIRINLYGLGPGRTVTANCARIVQERPAVGGMAYQVERVLRPVKPERTVAHLLSNDPRLSTMKRLVEQADLMDTLRTANPLTAFFPTDEAFDKMDPALRFRLLSGEGCVGAFVSHLLTKHTVCTDAARMRVSAQTMDGDFVMLKRVTSDGDGFTLDDVKLGPHDIMASNGVLHLLDDVVLPDSARPVSQLLKSRNLTHWYDLLEKADLLDEVDAAQNATLFVPTKAAMLTPEGELLAEAAAKLGDDKGKAALRDVLRYHLARPALELDRMANNQMLPTNLEDAKLRVNLYATIPFLNGAITSATVQCARVEDANNRACGAVLHEVDRVIRPATDSVMQMVEQRADLSMLRDIIKASSYVDRLSQANSPDFPAFTLLAPTNQAFTDLDDADRIAKLKTDVGHADSFVQRHLLPSSLCCSGVGVSSWMFTHRVPSLKKDVAHKLRRDGLNRPHIGDAVVQQCDVVATNGIMHVVDTPLLPPKQRQTAPQSNNRRRTSNLEILLFGL